MCLFLFPPFECYLAPRGALFLCSVFILGNSILLLNAGKAGVQHTGLHQALTEKQAPKPVLLIATEASLNSKWSTYYITI